MPFNPTYASVDFGSQISMTQWNALINDIGLWASDIPGTDLPDPLVMSGGISGSKLQIYGFKNWTEIRDIVSYGALPDFSTDSTSSIQAAIDSLPATGGTILVPPGTFRIDTSINLVGTSGDKSGVVLLGLGNASVLKFNDSHSGSDPMILCGGSSDLEGPMVADLKIDGNSSAGTGVMISSYATSQKKNGPFISGCDISGFQYGIKVNTTNGCDAPSIIRCRVHDNSIDGITLSQCNRASIQFCMIYNNQTSGIVLDNTTYVDIYGCLTVGNRYGITIGHANPSLVYSVNIRGCRSLDTVYGLSMNSEHTGSSITNGTISASVFRSHVLLGAISGSLNPVSLSGCIIKAKTGGIQITEGGANSSFVGSVFWNNEGMGLLQFGTGTSANMLTIFGNAFIEDRKGQGEQQYGIDIYTDTTEAASIVGNVFYGNTVQPIYDAGTTDHGPSPLNDVSHNVGA